MHRSQDTNGPRQLASVRVLRSGTVAYRLFVAAINVGVRQDLMKVLELNQGGITCNEVLAVLRDHGANKQGSQRRALPSECQARPPALEPGVAQAQPCG